MAARKRPRRAGRVRDPRPRDPRARDARQVAVKNQAPVEQRASDAAARRGIERSGAPPLTLDFELPSLAGIRVRVPPGAPVTEADVDARIEQLRHQLASAQPVPFGARVERGDQVELDVMGYHEGEMFLTLVREWMIARDNEQLPGFFDQVQGMFVGEEKAFKIRLSEVYVDEALRGEEAAFAVKVHSARRPELPALGDELWRLLGATGEQEARDAVRGELIKERADELVARARELVLDEIYARAQVRLDEQAVEHALNELWRHQEGDALAAQSASLDAQEEARARFLADEGIRDQVRRAFFERALLDKVIAQQGVAPDQGDVLKLVLELVNGTALSTNRVHEALTSGAGWDDAMQARLRDLRAMEWILGQVEVVFS